jgi:peroxiredoxin
MNKIATSIAVCLTILLVIPATFAQETEKGKAPGRARPPRPTIERGADAQGQAVQRLQRQMDELKASHQALVAELRAIHAAAVKEKASETAGLIEKLIVERQQVLQDNLRRLEMQQQRLERAARETDMAVPPVRTRQAPAFELSSFEGTTVKLSDYKDRIVVLEWINLECPFVQYHYNKAGTMTALAEKYKDKGVVWLAINSTSHTTPEANRDFAGEHKLPYLILDDRSGKVGRLYGAVTTPHMFIIDKNGVIVYDGAIDNAPLGKTIDDGEKVNYVGKALAELVSGKSVSTPKTPSYGCSVKYPSQIPTEPKTEKTEKTKN